ncbi:hypothetical protein LCGC14_2467320 [marine sediment metagenome]|uniref:Uncharacterized protein n=1 Tax=marine sediment metagenome TaxID=412755 RepID=A0A0F9E5H4_9ZZZZ
MEKLSWRTIIAVGSIVITIGGSTIAITADTFKELRRVDREHQEMITELKVQTGVTINELSHTNKQLEEMNDELKEIKEILKKIVE